MFYLAPTQSAPGPPGICAHPPNEAGVGQNVPTFDFFYFASLHLVRVDMARSREPNHTGNPQPKPQPTNETAEMLHVDME